MTAQSPKLGDDRSNLAQLMAPGRRAAPVTPSDSQDNVAKNATLYVGTGGDLKVLPLDNDSPVTLKNVLSGTFPPLAVRRVYATGTTAQDIVAIF